MNWEKPARNEIISLDTVAAGAAIAALAALSENYPAAAAAVPGIVLGLFRKRFAGHSMNAGSAVALLPLGGFQWLPWVVTAIGASTVVFAPHVERSDGELAMLGDGHAEAHPPSRDTKGGRHGDEGDDEGDGGGYHDV